MPHISLLDGLLNVALGAVAGLLAFSARWFFTSYSNLQRRVLALEAQAARTEERHIANLERLDRIDVTTSRIDQKMDRLIERHS